MKSKPLVSILMPVYNSYDFVRSENQNLITKALDSLLAQTYKNFELIILDNQSTDDTPKICKTYAEKDPRIRYIVDTQKRYPEGGITQAATFAKGSFVMIANDDDLWDKAYIETLLAYLEQNPKIDMCYTNGSFINIHGKTRGKIITKKSHSYSSDFSPLSNFSRYSLNRNPIPFAFGIFRKESFLTLMPFKDFDVLKANVDNLFVSEFFLRNMKCGFLDINFFSYRLKKRTLVPSKIPGMPGLDKPALLAFYYLRHQLELQKRLRESASTLLHPNRNQSYFILTAIIRGTLTHSLGLFSWIKEDTKMKVTGTEVEKKIQLTLKKYPALGNFSDDNPENIRFETILVKNLLANSLEGLSGLKKILDAGKEELGSQEILSDIENLLYPLIKECEGVIRDFEAELSIKPAILTYSDKNPQLNPNPKVTVISCSMNLARFIEETMNSVKNQSSNDYEHIVIDGGSTDETLEILKKYPHIKIVSEKDTGYPDAFWKGLRMARGKYIMQCAVSDAYAHPDWIKRCIEELDKDPDISLVWGLPGRLSEESILTAIARPNFHYQSAPEKKEFFMDWLMNYFVFPEGNLCVKKEVIERCYPTLQELQENNILDWREFSLRFNLFGYLSKGIPMMANFGRTHGNQLGEQIQKDGSLKKSRENYTSRVSRFRNKIIFTFFEPSFVDYKNRKIEKIQFSKKEFIRKYAIFILNNSFKIDERYLTPSKYISYIKRKINI